MRKLRPPNKPPIDKPTKTTKSDSPAPKIVIVRDSREKEGYGWRFPNMVIKKLDTGDYSVEGFEQTITIDRKGSASEFVGNLYQKRFERELERMSTFKYAVILLEFELDTIANWHANHPRMKRVPKHWKWKGAILSQFWKISLKYPHVHFIFAGSDGKAIALSMLKRGVELYGKKNSKTSS